MKESGVILVKFISFTSLSSGGLTHKVNSFIESNPDIEIVDIKYAASFGSVYAAILYR